MESKNIIPIYKSCGSIGKSILTVDKEYDIKDDSTVSIIAISKKFNLKEVIIIDDSFFLFPQIYKNFVDECTKVIFGINFIVCNDVKDKNDKSRRTESKVSILMKNSNGYQDLIKIYNAAKSVEENFYFYGRLDWKIIHSLWTDNLYMILPPYDNFIHKNLLCNGSCVPDFKNINPLFTFADQDIPFDNILIPTIKEYAEIYKFDLSEVHPIYYYRRSDFETYMTFRAIDERNKFENINLDYFCSPEFCFESYANKVGIKFE